MAEQTDPTDASQLLAALADGELNATGRLAALKYLAGHPHGAAHVEHEMRLRQAVSRSMGQVPAGPSAALRQRLTLLVGAAARRRGRAAPTC